MDPGYVKKRNNKTFRSLLEDEEDLNNYCPYCSIIKTSINNKKEIIKHCYTCNRCVLNYDRHCLWINNCIGKKLSFSFLLFLMSLIANCFYKGFLIINTLVNSKSNELKNSTNIDIYHKYFKIVVMIILIIGILSPL